MEEGVTMRKTREGDTLISTLDEELRRDGIESWALSPLHREKNREGGPGASHRRFKKATQHIREKGNPVFAEEGWTK